MHCNGVLLYPSNMAGFDSMPRAAMTPSNMRHKYLYVPIAHSLGIKCGCYNNRDKSEDQIDWMCYEKKGSNRLNVLWKERIKYYECVMKRKDQIYWMCYEKKGSKILNVLWKERIKYIECVMKRKDQIYWMCYEKKGSKSSNIMNVLWKDMS